MANIANLITKLSGIIASLDDIRDAISQGGGGSSTASGVTVTPVAPLTGTNLQATTNETAALLQEHTDDISTLNSRIDTKVGDWVSINSATVGNAVTVDISAYKEILFVFNPTAPSRAYMTTGVVPTAFLQINDTFAYGCGGTLNSATPYGIRCAVQYISQNTFSFLHAFYDNANNTSAVMYVYAR